MPFMIHDFDLPIITYRSSQLIFFNNKTGRFKLAFVLLQPFLHLLPQNHNEGI